MNERWSKLVTTPDSSGVPRTWHLLDNESELAAAGLTPTGTILCVHGNPTWSYLWRSVLAEAVRAGAGADARATGDSGGRAGAGEAAGSAQVWRVIAVDQLEMGFSERSDETRTLARRIADLGALTDTLGLEGPVVTLGHDWGGVVSLGWAVDHPELLAGVMLLNTAVHQPEQFPLPAALRLVLKRSMLTSTTVHTTAFLDTTLAIAHPSLAPDVRRAFRAPYRSAARRAGIGAFVADIPVDESHVSYAELTRVATGVAALTVPAIMLWGPRDPVFSDRYLGDLMERLPQADVTRFENAGHLVGEDVAVAPILLSWLGERVGRAGGGQAASVEAGSAEDGLSEHGSVEDGPAEDGTVEDGLVEDGLAEHAPAEYRPLWATLLERAADPAAAVVEMLPKRTGGGQRTVSWRLLAWRVDEIAAGLRAVGVAKGDRVSLLIPPGADLTAVLYACLRIGAVVVVADAGLGVRGLSRAVRGALPQHVIGIERALAAGRALGWPGQKISVHTLSRTLAATLGVQHSLADLARLGRARLAAGGASTGGGSVGGVAAGGDAARGDAASGVAAGGQRMPAPDDTAAILFTSGSTGPAKGVVYTHRQLSALVAVVRERFGIDGSTGLVAGFAPFALLGPALGATSVTPDMDVTAPKTLTATAVADAARAVSATVVFASPAALTNVVETSAVLTLPQRRVLGRVKTVLSAGAPLPVPLLEAVQSLMPDASIHTPYGMTEGLLMTDITLGEILRAEAEAEALAEAQQEARRDDSTDSTSAHHPGGVCVGRPIAGVHILLSPLDDEGRSVADLTELPGVTGEIVVSAPHLKNNYDQLWLTDREATRQTPAVGRWHRTGDVGHFDAAGRLWVEGRLVHVVTTASGVLTPVGIEQRAESLPDVRRAALVAVGPVGTQQPVVVVELAADHVRHDGSGSGRGLRARGGHLASTELVQKIRRVTGVDVVAVLVIGEMPTDIRHNSKIDRAGLSRWATALLAGRRPPKLGTPGQGMP
ncbi:alpha/beta fold hydrolase [Subtercola endophyticus]|nr:alpha/beta fold hydrolase [Subtercola endophyticus]UFS61075.1 alpha/beta fold hydrolase [Subtercola endophyticus]